MLDLAFDYETCVRNSEKVAWKLDEVFPEDATLDFSRNFLPDSLTRSSTASLLTEKEQRQLNQIGSNAYLNMFAFVEEFILATAVQHANAELFNDHMTVRALTRFADEEIKHQQLFRRYTQAFDRDFGVSCGVLQSAVPVAHVVLSKGPIAVLLITLHIELFTQQHYVESVKDNQELDPFFASLLKHHWLEESQHAKIDMLELDKLIDMASPEMIQEGFDQYVEIIEAFDGLLHEQATLDQASLEAIRGEALSEEAAKQLIDIQHHCYRDMFLVCGFNNKTFRNVMKQINPAFDEVLDSLSTRFGRTS